MFTLNQATKDRIDRKSQPISPDFWTQFLMARSYFIASCREEGQTDQQIYEALWMSGPDHVERIRQALEIE